MVVVAGREVSRPERVGFSGQLLQPDGSFPSTGVVFGKRNYKTYPTGPFGDQAFCVQREVDEAEVDLALEKRLYLGVRCEILKEHVDGGNVLREEPERLPQESPVGFRRDPDHDLPRLGSRCLPRKTTGVLGRGQNPPRLVEEALAGRRQFDMPLGATKEIHLELPFEVSDLLAQGRLGSVEASSRTAEVQFFGDRREISQVAKFHAAFIDKEASRAKNWDRQIL